MTDALFAAHQLTALAPDSDQALLREVSLSIPKSGITLLTGRNGSGKTILLRTLIGLHDTWHGECLYNGRSLRKSIPRIRREVGFLFQNPLYQLVERSVLDDIILSLRYRGISRTEALKQIEPIVESLQLSSLLHRDPYSLSTGEQRRTIIAGMLAGGAKTLLLDEPFTGLDYPGACELIRHILQLRSAGCSVIVCTHDLIKIFKHSDHCIVLEDGMLRYSGDAEGLRQLQHQDDRKLELEPITDAGCGSYP